MEGRDYGTVSVSLFVCSGWMHCLFAHTEQKLKQVMNEFTWMCDERDLKVNAGKSRVVVFKRNILIGKLKWRAQNISNTK